MKGTQDTPECVSTCLRCAFTCLDADKLKADMWQWQYTFQYDDPPAGPTNAKLRYIAYRQYVQRVHGLLRAFIRVVIPSCVVRRIRREFPAGPGEAYEGYDDYSNQ